MVVGSRASVALVTRGFIAHIHDFTSVYRESTFRSFSVFAADFTLRVAVIL